MSRTTSRAASTSARGTSHLLLKGNTYYFRCAVPREHRGLLGCSELRRSLGTGYAGEARLRAKRLALAAHDIFRMLARMTREGRLVNEDLEDVRKFVDIIFREALEQNEMQRFADHVPDYPRELDYLPGDTEKRIAYFKWILAKRDYDRLEGVARVFCEEDVGVDFPEDPAKRRMLAHEIAKHFIDYYTICMHRSQGDFNYEKTVYPPKPDESLTAFGVDFGPAPASPVLPATPAPKPTPPLSTVIAEYGDLQVAAGAWTERSRFDIQSTLSNLVDILGDVPVGSIDYEAMRTFKSTLLRLPPNRKKAKAYRDKSVAEILAMEPAARISKTTFNNIMTNVASFCEWCKTHGHMTENYAKGMKVKQKHARPDSARDVYTPEGLALLFGAKGYTGDSFKHAYMFWIPLLCAFTGARLEELCQLYVADVREADGVWVLDINENPDAAGNRDKHVKNGSSIRLVPIHPVLRDLGFLDYRASVAAAGNERLFPELKKIRERYSHDASKWFGRFRKSVGLTSDKFDLHAFRHTVINLFKQQRIPREDYSEVTGHAKESTADRVYAKTYPPAVLLRDVVEKIDYGLDLSHLKGSKYGTGVTTKEAKEGKKGKKARENRE
ncbi:integrase family protein [Desulfovibrio sp. X2]|uniref:site-specific integrase n=1 Tax=Desulfovibrio sp. X2 TaxID=941449 RepID=UPI0003586E08|nr:site-specific integrase [Desulfovibrio sp. X2]EPR43904.1 integrase family protein [Desulfovibrio sp. X2]